MDKHGRQQTPIMPWAGYAFLKTEDVRAMVAFLRSLPPVRFEPPANVAEGDISEHPWVRFSVFTSNPSDETITERVQTR